MENHRHLQQRRQLPPLFSSPNNLHHYHQPQQVHAYNEEVVIPDGFYYPPGYKFCPTDEELVSEYLIKRNNNDQELQPSCKRRRKHIIPEVNIYKDSPEAITSGFPLGKADKENEWYFFTPLGRRYPNGDRPSRQCDGAGFWKLTGSDHEIKVGDIVVARKKCLEFYEGKVPGKKTDWKMHEYRPVEETSSPTNGQTKRELQPALCRIYINTRKKDKGNEVDQGSSVDIQSDLVSVPPSFLLNGHDFQYPPEMNNAFTAPYQNGYASDIGEHLDPDSLFGYSSGQQIKNLVEDAHDGGVTSVVVESWADESASAG